MLDGGDEAVVGARFALAAPTLVRVASSCDRSPQGAPIRLTAHLRTTRDDVPLPTGSVVFRAGHRVLGTAVVTERGEAVLDEVLLPAGLHAVVASYSGDAHHAAASSTALPQAVAAPLLPVVLAVAVPVPRPEGVVLEAELLDPETGRLVDDASGSVTFQVGEVELAEVVIQSGQARVVVPDLPEGELVASYPGAGEYAAATGRVSDSVVLP